MHYNLYKNGEKVGETQDKKHVFEGLTPNTEYEFGVSAVENETESEIITITKKTEATPTPQPEKPTNVEAVELDFRHVKIKWNQGTQGEQYSLFLNGTASGNSELAQYEANGLAPNTEYTIGIVAVLNGVESEMTEFTFTTTAVPSPVMTVTNVSNDNVAVEWQSSVEGTYKVYKDDVEIASGYEGNTYNFNNLEPNTEYTLGVALEVDGYTSEIVTQKVTTVELTPSPTNESDISNFHVGAGWYELPNGERVRGKEAAEEELKKIDE